MRKVLIIISTEDGESIYNAMRLANLGVKIGWMDDLYELSMEADKVLTF
ncbi:MAG: hypothetical protein U9Q89_02610 [Thermodesulfobacteriota bacterium]|nr:hypothetical protein [Thermodesulfobacteriota bacterium]